MTKYMKSAHEQVKLVTQVALQQLSPYVTFITITTTTTTTFTTTITTTTFTTTTTTTFTTTTTTTTTITSACRDILQAYAVRRGYMTKFAANESR